MTDSSALGNTEHMNIAYAQFLWRSHHHLNFRRTRLIYLLLYTSIWPVNDRDGHSES